MNKLFKKLAGGFMALTMMFSAAASAPRALKPSRSRSSARIIMTISRLRPAGL